MDALNSSVGAIETKSEPVEDGEAGDVAAALDTFRSAVTDRLDALEAKSADPKLADRLAAVERRLSRPGAAVETKSAADLAADKSAIERKAFMSFIRQGDERMAADERKSMTASVDVAGGYLIPPLFAVELLKYLVQFSPIRQYAKVMQVSGPAITFPRRTTLLAASIVSETTATPASQPAFEQITIPNYEFATFVPLSNQLIADNAYNLEAEIASEFALAFAVAEGQMFVSGTGSANNQPMGLLNSPQISAIPSAATGAVGLADIITLFHAIPTVWAQQGVWVMNRNTMASLRSIVNQIGEPLFLNSTSSTAPSTLLGRPIVEALDMPGVASGASPIIFGDLGGYRITDREGLSTLRDPFSQAAQRQTLLHAYKRTGADVTDGKRLVKLTVK